jgi:S1-C subfamily serine protease
LILTNNHVVGGAQKINVTLGNNEVLEGTIVGSCAIHDIAVVKINGNKRNLQAAELGDSDKIRGGKGSMLLVTPSA